jgi:cysteinyl-tRNA synthetase
MIKLYDTMARQKRAFEPQDSKRITMYVCGPTVYGRAHIGNARPAVVFDTLARLIRHTYGEDSLVYARNVTDVDDKIIAAAEPGGHGSTGRPAARYRAPCDAGDWADGRYDRAASEAGPRL